ncbi:DnaB-like helicase C-terminal domain-containing protein [Herbaspirillum sp. VT-16-41]|uniref:DnaB-like helicase C-terminal domain-containing protein n=1 Tax=Herbaspirillum sp. VT-16-41 TaxID=1953765 RepID=UPI000980EF98|nr:DnaB-like helicase C-terminal domain-containing protein [Herbaspirillum sp. VT-16-41]ONN64814.1 hypothetical protein BTM36_22190 [Herbaspirillum sp. VT-16-41]
MQLIPDNIDFSAYMDEPPAEHRVVPASSLLDSVIDHFFKPSDAPQVQMGWRKTHGDFEFRPAEVSLWAGINGHGKSQVIGQVALDLMDQSQRVCVSSLEMAVAKVMARMARQAAGRLDVTRPFLNAFLRWTDGRLWLYDHMGSTDPRTIVAVIRYSVEQFGIQHFVVDNLAKVIEKEDDYNGQKAFVNSLCTVAKDTGVHIHLVLHVKKGESEHKVPGKFDIKGSGAIADLVDNIFVVWRNKAKEEEFREGNHEHADDPDCLLKLEKQRHGETEGSYRLWFHPGSMQYLESRHDRPKVYRIEPTITSEEVVF